MTKTFPRPPKATCHCRHYSYVLPITKPGSGPTCGKGVDLTAPGASFVCMPDNDKTRGVCSVREEYTDTERAVWREAINQSQERMVAAIGALPRPIPLQTSGMVECPNCEGRLRFSRWERGAAIQCETGGCCGARFSIAAGADWPSPK